MTTKNWTGQTTLADDTALTPSNSGGGAGDAFDGPNPYATGSATVKVNSTAPVITGSKQARLIVPAGATSPSLARMYWQYATSGAVFQERVAVRQRVDPGGANLICALTDTSFNSQYPVQVYFTTRSGARHAIVALKNVEVADFGAWPSFGSTQADWYWLEFYIVKGTTTSTPKGEAVVVMRDWEGTELQRYTSPVGGVNTGTVNFARMIYGGNTDVRMDMEISWAKAGTDAAALFGLPATTIVPPTLVVPSRPDPFNPGTLTIPGFEGHDTDGTITALHAVVLSGPTSPTLTTVVTSGLSTPDCLWSVRGDFASSGQWVIDTWVTDNAGQDSTHGQVTIDTLSDTELVSILEDKSPAGWTVAGASTALAAMTDGDDATTKTSGSAPSHQIGRWRIGAVEPGRPVRFRVRAKRTPVGGLDVSYSAKLYTSGGTLVETVTVDELGNPLTLTTSFTDTTVSFAATSLTTPASRVDLEVALDFTQA